MEGRSYKAAVQLYLFERYVFGQTGSYTASLSASTIRFDNYKWI